MSFLRPLSHVLLLGLLGPLGCGVFTPDDGRHDDGDDSFVHRAYTSWAPLPSADGSRLAFMLEPRRVDADSQGVMITGWHGKVAGEAVIRSAVGDDSGRVIGSLGTGFHFVDHDPSTAYAFASNESEWTPTAPNDPAPPPSHFVSVTWIDRATLSVRGTRALDPPLEWPYALGGGLLLDTPHEGTSDVARDVHLTTFDVASGERRTVHEARGFAAFECARTHAVTVAYRPEGRPGTTTIVDVTLDDSGHAARAVKLDVDDFGPKAIVCRSGGKHAAVVGTRRDGTTARIVVVEDRGDVLALVKDVAASEPAALSTDGATLLATKEKQQAALFSPSAAAGFDLPGVIVTGRADVSGERALVNGAQQGFIVRLDGTSPRSMPVDHPSKVEGSRSGFGVGEGRFMFFDATQGDAAENYAEHVVAAFLMDADGHTNDVDIDPSYSKPHLAYANGKVAHVLADRVTDSTAVDVLTIDLDAHAVTSTARSMFCDQATIREKNQCLP